LGELTKNIVVGIDLAGVEARDTGFCILDEKLNVKTTLLHTDREIVKETLAVKPTLVSIDAPLALPKGRCCLRNDCECRGRGHLRECDRVLLKMRIRFFPITIGPMRTLTERGIKLSKTLSDWGLRVMESFPGSVQDILGMPRKNEGLEKLRKAMIKYGIKGEVNREDITDHELDAVASALVGKLYLEGEAVEIGDPQEALMIIPKPKPLQS
jgi:predicted nuclease with RNAse H fold